MQFKHVLYLLYYEAQNVFTDDEGQLVLDLYNIITPSDLFLFRKDPGNSTFPMVGNRRVLVEIIVIPEEVCGWQAIPDIDWREDLATVNRHLVLERMG